MTTWAGLLLAWAAQDDEAARVAERINRYRAGAGLEAVTVDPSLTKGCAAHAAYLVRNADHPSTRGLGLHGADPKLPGFTPEGLRAAKASVIFLGLEGPEAVDGWIASLFHRIPLLDSRLKRIGVGSARGGPSKSTVVVDVINGRGPLQGLPAVVYPADGQKDVPRGFCVEIPDSIPLDEDGKAGYPVTATFGEGLLVKDVKATLRDAEGKVVECWASSPQNPAAADYQRNTIGLIPRDPLRPATAYTASVTCTLNGKLWTRTWSFITR